MTLRRSGFLIVLALWSLFGAVSCAGQTYVDVVHLKNGNTVRGMIIEQVPNESVKIKGQDGSIFVFSMDEVLKFTKEIDHVAASERSARIEPGPRERTDLGTVKHEGFVNISQVSYGLGIGEIDRSVSNASGLPTESSVDNASNYIRFETVNGFWLDDGTLSLGIGIAYQYYSLEDFGQLPVFLDIRLLPLVGRTVPVVILQPGYSFGLVTDDTMREGLGIAAGLGLSTQISEKNALVLGLLYDHQRYNNETALLGTTYDVKATLNTFRVSLGMTF